MAAQSDWWWNFRPTGYNALAWSGSEGNAAQRFLLCSVVLKPTHTQLSPGKFLYYLWEIISESITDVDEEASFRYGSDTDRMIGMSNPTVWIIHSDQPHRPSSDYNSAAVFRPDHRVLRQAHRFLRPRPQRVHHHRPPLPAVSLGPEDEEAGQAAQLSCWPRPGEHGGPNIQQAAAPAAEQDPSPRHLQLRPHLHPHPHPRHRGGASHLICARNFHLWVRKITNRKILNSLKTLQREHHLLVFPGPDNNREVFILLKPYKQPKKQLNTFKY